MKYSKIKQAYTDVLEVCNKYVGETEFANSPFRDIEKMKEESENHLALIEWYEKYGLDLEHDCRIRGYDYCKVSEYIYISYFKDAKEEKTRGHGRYISWEDNDKQPLNEWLYSITFSTGAYIFGDDYPNDLFNEFWNELKTYEPKYCDSTNHCLYFSLENASKIHSSFKEIINKYFLKNKEQSKERKIKKLQAELDKLTN